MGERGRLGGRSKRKPGRRLNETSARLVGLQGDHARRTSDRHRRRSSRAPCPNPAGGLVWKGSAGRHVPVTDPEHDVGVRPERARR
jgi:hypothetical protein